MTNEEYKKYLNSSHWKDVKQRYKASKLIQKCYVCGSKEKIHIHHKSYTRIGNEKLNDLIPLCETCHAKVHKYLRENKSGKTTLWNVARKVRNKSR